MVKLVIFDLDGLLLDTERFNLISKIEESKKLGFNVTPEIVVKSFGMCSEKADEYFKNIYGPTFDYYKIKGKRFKYIIEEIKKNGLPLKPGVKELLKEIKEKNIKCAIATTSTRAFIDEYRKYDNEFFGMFDGIITGDEILYGKPNPDIFLKCCKMFNINVNDALVLEDSKTGIIAAHNGNIKSCFIEDLVPLDDEIKKYATYLFDSLLDVIKLI